MTTKIQEGREHLRYLDVERLPLALLQLPKHQLHGRDPGQQLPSLPRGVRVVGLEGLLQSALQERYRCSGNRQRGEAGRGTQSEGTGRRKAEGENSGRMQRAFGKRRGMAGGASKWQGGSSFARCSLAVALKVLEKGGHRTTVTRSGAVWGQAPLQVAYGRCLRDESLASKRHHLGEKSTIRH